MSFISMILCLHFLVLAEEPPPAEYPYPQKSAEQNYPKDVQQPKKKEASGEYNYGDDYETKTYKIDGVEGPESVGSDGTYYYDTDLEIKDSDLQGVEKPTDKNDDGTYEYDTKIENKDNTPAGVDRPHRVKSDGSYVYLKDRHEYDKALYLRLGVQGPYDFKGSNVAGTPSYKDIYSEKAEFVLAVDYEWRLFKSLGSFLFKVGSGLSFAQGKGRFKSQPLSTQEPKETFQFLLFPNTATLSYKFEYSHTQLLVPFVDFGAGYFTFIEQRSDNEVIRFGGALVALASGGLMLNLEPLGIGVDAEDGYSRSWFVVQFRQHLGLDDRKDFTSNSITAGIAVGW